MNCQQALQQLYEILDKEASQVTRDDFYKHLDECKPCLSKFQLEEAFHKFLISKEKEGNGSSDLEALKLKVLERLDRVDREKSGDQNQRNIGTTKLWSINRVLTIAASLVLVLGAAYVGNDIYSHGEAFIPLERAHWDLDDNISFYENTAVTSQSLASVYDKFGYHVLPAVAGFNLTGGKVEEIMGVKMGHFVYIMGDKTVSVYVAPAAEFKIPDELYEHAVVTDNGEFYDHHCRGCRLVYHKAGNAVIVTGTTDDDVELLRFIPGTAVI